MNYEKLLKQDFFFINCNTTYYQSALSYFEKENKKDILLFLADSKLRYIGKFDGDDTAEDKVSEGNDEEEVIYDKDPFYQQPIRLYSKKNDILFNQRSFGDFLIFLKNNFNIKSRLLFSPLTKDQATSRIQKGFINNELFIINVDSYWCPFHPMLYKKIHARHGLLVKALDIKNNTIEVIDTNHLMPYTLDYDELLAGLNTNNFVNTIIIINGNDFSCSINYKEKLDTFLKDPSPIDFIDKIYKNLQRYLCQDSYLEAEKDFHSKRHVFAIKFQLLPYLKMRQHLFQMNLISCAFKEIEQSILIWTLLSDVLLFLRYNEGDIPCEILNTGEYNTDSPYMAGDYTDDSVFILLNQLAKLEDEIADKIKTINVF